MKLLDSLLACERTVVIENYYASVELANKDFDHDTRSLGTLQTAKEIHVEVIKTKLKKGHLRA